MLRTLQHQNQHQHQHQHDDAAAAAEHPVAVAGRHVLRYGLVIVIAWIGALKYTLGPL